MIIYMLATQKYDAALCLLQATASACASSGQA